MTGTVHLQNADPHGIAHVVLDNPGKLNAMSVAMWQALRTVFEQLQADAGATRVVIVSGTGGAFASGGDIEEFPDFRFNPATLRAFHEGVVLLALKTMLDCDLPLVARIDGACIGGGLEIAGCCDIRIAAESSRFGIPIAKLGFPLAPAELEIVQRVTGPTVLRELLIEGRVLHAADALRRGLVTRVVADAELAREVQASATHIASLSPQALRLNKRALREWSGRTTSTAEQRAPYFDYADTAEHREGLAAFNEKRAPRF